MEKESLFYPEDESRITNKNIIDSYLRRGFGSMNKNDFEVWIFSQLMLSRFIGKSNYEISVELKIPESKVKRLRYEADLKYSNNSADSYFQKLNALLEKSTIKENGESIRFVIEDVSLRYFLDSHLKKDGRFSDTSFNSEIVTIDLDDLEYLLCQVNPNKELKEKLEKLGKGNSKDKITLKGIVKKYLETSIEEGSRIITNKIVNLSIQGIVQIIPHLFA